MTKHSVTIQEILRKTYSEYKLSPLDMGILLSLALKRPREYILARPEKQLTKLQEKKFISFAKRRSAGEPIAYITGRKEFFGLDFLVNKNVLIPRPETELMVEQVLEKIKAAGCKMPSVIIDVGTGSGDIIVSIEKNIPERIKSKISLFAADISKKSLRIAKDNAKKHKIGKRIKFVQSDLLEYFFKNKIKLKNVLIIANLPYVSQYIYKKNKINLKYEPKQALFSSGGGLAHYKKLFRQLKLSNAHCSLFIEISPEQKAEICRIINKLLPKAKTKFYKDLAGKWRMAEIEIDR